MRMRALVIHNYYRSENASGENLSVSDEIDGLRAAGWDIEVVSSDSDVIADGIISMPELALRPLYSGLTLERVNDAMRRFRPHVALVENLFPLHSPAVIRTLRSRGVPVAAGVRSYRMVCAASTLYREGRECRDCVGSRLNLPAIRHGCFQQSSRRTVPIAASLRLYRSTFRSIDAFLAVSDFVRDELVAAGFDAERIVVRPNFVDDPRREIESGDDESREAQSVEQRAGQGFVFGGRLTDDKGIEPMVQGWQRSEVWSRHRLRIAGSGPLEPLIRDADARYRIQHLGLVAHDQMLREISDAAVTVIPSAWPEPFGRGVIEAAARGRAALVTRSGGLPELVEDGVTGWVSELDPDAIAASFRRAADPVTQLQCGLQARRRFEERYTRGVSVGILDATLRDLAERGLDV
jgi:glycosyltransferase involved in cell wall biosynthesis